MQTFVRPSQDELMKAAIDISEPRVEVEVQHTEGGDRLWINVDGVCVLRIQNMKPGVLKLPTEKDEGAKS